MSLLSVKKISSSAVLGLWKIEGNEQAICLENPFLEPYLQELRKRYSYEPRRMEKLSVMALLHEIAPDAGPVTHNASGKPLLSGYHVSISHTLGYAAVILSKKENVAVDIEYQSERVKKIASRFLRHDEKADDVGTMLLHWCAKETVYKYFSEDDLRFSEMRVSNIMQTFCKVENLKNGSSVNVNYKSTGDYMLAYIG